MALNEPQREAIASADAHVANAGLPSYTELRKALQAVCLELNTRGELSEGGSDFNTSIGNAYRAANDLLG